MYQSVWHALKCIWWCFCNYLFKKVELSHQFLCLLMNTVPSVYFLTPFLKFYINFWKIFPKLFSVLLLSKDGLKKKFTFVFNISRVWGFIHLFTGLFITLILTAAILMMSHCDVTNCRQKKRNNVSVSVKISVHKYLCKDKQLVFFSVCSISES